jgi:hypothetical protein
MGIEEDIKKFNKFADYIEGTRDIAFLTFSFEKAVLMPDKEFAELYLKLMNILRVTKNWWSEGNTPSCAYCGEEISGPKQLRMYVDNPYHPSCFKEVYDDSDESELMKKYWDRVLNLDF